jgi:hypothetical protein
MAACSTTALLQLSKVAERREGAAENGNLRYENTKQKEIAWNQHPHWNPVFLFDEFLNIFFNKKRYKGYLPGKTRHHKHTGPANR